MSERLIPAHAGKTAGLRGVRFRREAHPRSRGENWKLIVFPPPQVGSSPLTRGKHPESVSAILGERLIPAHAGKTPVGYPVGDGATAHPRSRGENVVLKSGTRYQVGSSPLTRGKLSNLGHTVLLVGLIPAHAGKTTACCQDCRARSAHPRSRGENLRTDQLIVTHQGSSPLTRGKQAVDCHGGAARGLIPAHAGKTRY